MKLIEWGFLGLGDGTAGLFLANYYPMIGSYFGDKIGHDWPHSPLHREPTKLELGFNEKMMKITEIISNGSLKEVSILDFPGFGSSIARLDRSHKIESNWPTEINFEILKGIHDDPLLFFGQFKDLLTDWENYIYQKLYQQDPHANFTASMKNSPFLNFTKYIREDPKTFLTAVHGSFLSPKKEIFPTWKNAAQTLFQNDESVSNNVFNDKLILECTFRKDLMSMNHLDGEGGCDFFLPTLTSNGLCHTFNGKATDEIWNNAMIMDAFKELFPEKHLIEHFQEGGDTEGENY